ncbi:hypothetical protein LTS18_008925, partial [Coniosporium uncinatum]
METQRRRIAVVGSGVSGIGAVYSLLNSGHEVYLYEAADRLGGHTNTVDFHHNGLSTPVDTGFIVMNRTTYPNFLAFLKELKINTIDTEMTFGVCRDEGKFEWSGTSLAAIFAQKRNIFSLSMWRMIFDIVRFNAFALDLLLASKQKNVDYDLSIGDYLEREGYSAKFRDDYLIPMTACVWSTGADKCALEFPAVTLVRFLWNHHLLNTLEPRPPWMTIPGGSKRYLDAVMSRFPQERVQLNRPVQTLRNTNDGKVVLTFTDGTEDPFDRVVLACHGDQAMNIISSTATSTEKDIMSCFQTTPNLAYLHSDTSLLPRRRVAWSAWNYLTTTSSHPRPNSSVNGDVVGLTEDKTLVNGDGDGNDSPSGNLDTVSLTYNMNILQHIPTSKFGDVLVTMNPPHRPDPAKTQAAFEYTHPLYNAAAVSAQERLDEIQGVRGVYYAG